MQKLILKSRVLLALMAGLATGAAQSNGAAAQGKAALLIMGDSVMKTVAVSLERDLAQSTEFRPISFASIGSGLCRLDLLDWHAKIKTLAETEKPAAAVILIGSNDNQPMQTEKGLLKPIEIASAPTLDKSKYFEMLKKYDASFSAPVEKHKKEEHKEEKKEAHGEHEKKAGAAA